MTSSGRRQSSGLRSNIPDHPKPTVVHRSPAATGGTGPQGLRGADNLAPTGPARSPEQVKALLDSLPRHTRAARQLDAISNDQRSQLAVDQTAFEAHEKDLREEATSKAQAQRAVTQAREEYVADHAVWMDIDGLVYATSIGSDGDLVLTREEEQVEAEQDRAALKVVRKVTIDAQDDREDQIVSKTVGTNVHDVRELRTETIRTSADGTPQGAVVVVDQTQLSADGIIAHSVGTEEYDAEETLTAQRFVQETLSGANATSTTTDISFGPDGATPTHAATSSTSIVDGLASTESTDTFYSNEELVKQTTVTGGDNLPTVATTVTYGPKGVPTATHINRTVADGNLPEGVPSSEYLVWDADGEIKRRFVGDKGTTFAQYEGWINDDEVTNGPAAPGVYEVTDDPAFADHQNAVDYIRDDNDFRGTQRDFLLAPPLEPTDPTPSEFEIPSEVSARGTAAAIDRVAPAPDSPEYDTLLDGQLQYERDLKAASTDTARNRIQREYFADHKFYVDLGDDGKQAPIFLAASYSNGIAASDAFGSERAAEPHVVLTRSAVEGSDATGSPASIDVVRHVYIDGTRDDLTRITTSPEALTGGSRVETIGEHVEANGIISARDRHVASEVRRYRDGLGPIAVTEVSRERYDPVTNEPDGDQYEATATTDDVETKLSERTDTFAGGTLTDTIIDTTQHSLDWQDDLVNGPEGFLAANEAVIELARQDDVNVDNDGTALTTPPIGAYQATSHQDIDYDSSGAAIHSTVQEVNQSVTGTSDYDDEGNESADANGVKVTTVTTDKVLDAGGSPVLDTAGTALVDTKLTTNIHTVAFDPDDGSAGGNKDAAHQWREITDVTTGSTQQPSGDTVMDYVTPFVTSTMQEGYDDDREFYEKYLVTELVPQDQVAREGPFRIVTDEKDGADIPRELKKDVPFYAKDGRVVTYVDDPGRHTSDLDAADNFEAWMEKYGTKIVMYGTIAAGVALAAFSGGTSLAAAIAVNAAFTVGATLSGLQLANTVINYRQDEASGWDVAWDTVGFVGFVVPGSQAIRAQSAARALGEGSTALRAGAGLIGASDDVANAATAASRAAQYSTKAVRYASNAGDAYDATNAARAAWNGDYAAAIQFGIGMGLNHAAARWGAHHYDLPPPPTFREQLNAAGSTVTNTVRGARSWTFGGNPAIPAVDLAHSSSTSLGGANGGTPSFAPSASHLQIQSLVDGTGIAFSPSAVDGHFTRHRGDWAGANAIDGVDVGTRAGFEARAQQLVADAAVHPESYLAASNLQTEGSTALMHRETGEVVIVTDAGNITTMYRAGFGFDPANPNANANVLHPGDGGGADVRAAAYARIDGFRDGQVADFANLEANLARTEQAIDNTPEAYRDSVITKRDRLAAELDTKTARMESLGFSRGNDGGWVVPSADAWSATRARLYLDAGARNQIGLEQVNSPWSGESIALRSQPFDAALAEADFHRTFVQSQVEASAIDSFADQLDQVDQARVEARNGDARRAFDPDAQSARAAAEVWLPPLETPISRGAEVRGGLTVDSTRALAVDPHLLIGAETVLADTASAINPWTLDGVDANGEFYASRTVERIIPIDAVLAANPDVVDILGGADAVRADPTLLDSLSLATVRTSGEVQLGWELVRSENGTAHLRREESRTVSSADAAAGIALPIDVGAAIVRAQRIDPRFDGRAALRDHILTDLEVIKDRPLRLRRSEDSIDASRTAQNISDGWRVYSSRAEVNPITGLPDARVVLTKKYVLEDLSPLERAEYIRNGSRPGDIVEVSRRVQLSEILDYNRARLEGDHGQLPTIHAYRFSDSEHGYLGTGRELMPHADSALADQAVASMEATFDHFYSRYGYTPSGGDFKVVVNAVGTPNAEIYTSRNLVNIGAHAGPGGAFDPSVLAHELAHKFESDFTAGTHETPQGGAISEGYADVLAVAYTHDSTIGRVYDGVGSQGFRDIVTGQNLITTRDRWDRVAARHALEGVEPHAGSGVISGVAGRLSSRPGFDFSEIGDLYVSALHTGGLRVQYDFDSFSDSLRIAAADRYRDSPTQFAAVIAELDAGGLIPHPVIDSKVSRITSTGAVEHGLTVLAYRQDGTTLVQDSGGKVYSQSQGTVLVGGGRLVSLDANGRVFEYQGRSGSQRGSRNDVVNETSRSAFAESDPQMRAQLDGAALQRESFEIDIDPTHSDAMSGTGELAVGSDAHIAELNRREEQGRRLFRRRAADIDPAAPIPLTSTDRTHKYTLATNESGALDLRDFGDPVDGTISITVDGRVRYTGADGVTRSVATIDSNRLADVLERPVIASPEHVQAIVDSSEYSGMLSRVETQALVQHLVTANGMNPPSNRALTEELFPYLQDTARFERGGVTYLVEAGRSLTPQQAAQVFDDAARTVESSANFADRPPAVVMLRGLSGGSLAGFFAPDSRILTMHPNRLDQQYVVNHESAHGLNPGGSTPIVAATGAAGESLTAHQWGAVMYADQIRVQERFAGWKIDEIAPEFAHAFPGSAPGADVASLIGSYAGVGSYADDYYRAGLRRADERTAPAPTAEAQRVWEHERSPAVREDYAESDAFRAVSDTHGFLVRATDPNGVRHTLRFDDLYPNRTTALDLHQQLRAAGYLVPPPGRMRELIEVELDPAHSDAMSGTGELGT